MLLHVEYFGPIHVVYRNHVRTGCDRVFKCFHVVFFNAPWCCLSDGCVLSDGGAETPLNHHHMYAVLLFRRTPGAISPMGALLNRNTPGRTTYKLPKTT